METKGISYAVENLEEGKIKCEIVKEQPKSYYMP